MPSLLRKAFFSHICFNIQCICGFRNKIKYSNFTVFISNFFVNKALLKAQVQINLEIINKCNIIPKS